MQERKDPWKDEPPGDHQPRVPESQEGLHLRAILDSLDDQMIVIDQDMLITEVNEAFLRMRGLQKPEVIGRPCYQVFHCLANPSSSEGFECPSARVWESGEPVRVNHIRQTGIVSEADVRHVEIIASPLKDSHGNVIEVIELFRDVTEVRRMQEQATKADQNVLALGAIASTVCQSLNLDTVLNLALEKVLTLMKANIGGILLLDEDTQMLFYRVFRGLSDDFVKGVAGLRLGEGIAGTVAQTGEPIYVGDISQDPRLTRPVVISEGLRAFASVPLRSKNRVLGVMNIASYTPRQFSHQDIQLLTSVADQMTVAIENAKLYTEMQSMAETRRELLRRIISSQEEERKRIARELHDDTSQVLSSLAVNMQALADALPHHPEQVKARLAGLQAVVTSMHDSLRRTMHELRPSLLDDYGLVAAARWLAENRVGAAGLEVHLETRGTDRRLPIEVETALFRIVHEASTNIIRHADANNVSIDLDFRENAIVVCIEDNGRGFKVDQVMTSDRRQGMGLLGMRERAELVGGKLSIHSRPGVGTRITVEVPVGQEVFDG
jgi:PAS domain S-box-containing protein